MGNDKFPLNVKHKDGIAFASLSDMGNIPLAKQAPLVFDYGTGRSSCD